MKKTALLLFLQFVLFSASSQDTIYKRNTEVVVARIIEITPTELKYKRFDFQDGPTYTELKANIALIVYANGMKERFADPEQATTLKNNSGSDNDILDNVMFFRYQGRPITQFQVHKILLDTKDREIMNLVVQSREARKWEFVGFGTIPFGAIMIAGLAGGIGNNLNDTESLSLFALGLAGTVACPIISGANRHKKQMANSAAIKLYNQKF